MAGLLFAASSGRCSARAMDLETAGAAYMENVTNALIEQCEQATP